MRHSFMLLSSLVVLGLFSCGGTSQTSVSSSKVPDSSSSSLSSSSMESKTSSTASSKISSASSTSGSSSSSSSSSSSINDNWNITVTFSDTWAFDDSPTLAVWWWGGEVLGQYSLPKTTSSAGLTATYSFSSAATGFLIARIDPSKAPSEGSTTWVDVWNQTDDVTLVKGTSSYTIAFKP